MLVGPRVLATRVEINCFFGRIKRRMKPMAGPVYDVIVVGAGNAGLTAALAARQQETRVLLLDKCPKAVRGGNTRFSGGGFRFTYNSLDDMRPMLPDLTDEEAAKMDVGTYTNAEFFEDVMQ
jgi:tricarballylate dehydrogenase